MQDAERQMDTSMALIHPLYTRQKPGHYDLALIRLPKRVRFNGTSISKSSQFVKHLKGKRNTGASNH